MSPQLDGVSDRVVVRAPAKINLCLSVRGRRDDGYHELTTVLQTVSLRDELHLRLTGPRARRHHPAGRRRMRVEVRSDDARIPAQGNLVHAAARLLGVSTRVLGEREQTSETVAATAAGSSRPERPWPCPSVRLVGDDDGAEDDDATLGTVIELVKAIPVGGGMAGGSTDAAATLLGLDALWGCDLSHDELMALAAELGSDVPFCLIGGTAIATGRGERVASVLNRGRYHWVVGVDEDPLPTPEVYRAWDELDWGDGAEGADDAPFEAVLTALRAGDPEQLGAALHNDLEPAACALRPALAERRDALRAAGALGAIVSGSGPTLLGLARDAEHAEAIATAVREHFDAVHVVRAPAAGPEILA